MSNKTLKIWYVSIVVIVFAFQNLILTNGIIKFGEWFKWVDILFNSFAIGMAAWKIVSQSIKIEENG